MSNGAPVCHIPPVVPANQPNPVNLPSIPPAQATIASLQATVNAMRYVVMYMSGQQGFQGQQGQQGKQGQPPTPPKAPRWAEVKASRVTETVRVFNPSDKTQFVDIQQINQITMKDSVTGNTWQWSR